jgi:hypothetical protein
MKKTSKHLLALCVILLGVSGLSFAQSTTATLSGAVADEQQKVIANATVTARNVETNTARSVQTDSEGRYRFTNLPIGAYELTVEAAGFAKYVRQGIELLVNQDAVIDVPLKVSGFAEVVTVTENASLLNTTNAEVSTRFDAKRLSELPLAPNRNVFNVLLSAPGVSQLGSGQTGFANGISFSSNGGRVRSNNFQIDGQDTNDPSVSGGQQNINNPDIVQEIRLVTNQFAAEYGRNSGSVVNIVTKSGTNEYHGSAFWFNNNNHFNACSNQDKAARPGGFCKSALGGTREGAPFRLENQIGGTFGGPMWLPRFGEGGPGWYNGKDRTWFFGSLQRWSDRQLGSGTTIRGVPTDAGRAVLQSAAGNRPQVAALLRFLPAAQVANNTSQSFTLGGQTYIVPLGDLTGSTAIKFDDWQWSTRIDHNLSENHRLSGRYLYDSSVNAGSGQATPFGLTTVVPTRVQSANISLDSTISNRLVNNFRIAWSRYGSVTTASDPSSESIPSIEINELGLTGFNAAASRTAIGLAVNLPQFRYNNTYQIQDNISLVSGSHAMKAGIDFRRTQVKSFFVPTIRGRLAYSTLTNFVNDVADLSAMVNRPLPGGQEIQYYNYYDYFFFVQDEWKVRPNFTLSYGLRYELPGNSFDDLVPINDRIVRTAGGDERYRFTPVPGTDKNNFQPRFGFNWSPRFGDGLVSRFLTGGDKLVIRGGYARTNDASFVNLNLNIASAFPFVAAINVSPNNAFQNIGSAQVTGLNPNTITRTIVGSDFRSPSTDQFTLEMQRELSNDVVLKVGYVGTKGNGLFQTLDGNPRLPTTAAFSSTAPVGSPNNPARVNPNRGVIRLRANAASSIYHSLQVSLDKRLSRNFSAGVHYTWSAFIDTASEVFNPSTGEVAVAQDSYNLRADRARSTYDRPHRLTGNFVYELPFFRDQQGFAGRLFGGFQLNSLFTFQSGAPFTALNGADPTGALNGIDGLVGNAIRPNIYTNLDVSRMKIEDLYVIDQGLRAQAVAQAQQIFNALPAAQRVVGALPGATLPNTLFTLSQGRIIQQANGTLAVTVDFRGLPTSGVRTGNAGRNILRADGIGNVDFGIAKNTRIRERHTLQFRADMFNATNTRNFGIPIAAVNGGANFLNQWATNGGNRRIQLGLRYTF